MEFDVSSAVLWIFPLLLAVVLHEWVHGYAAFRLGDATAERMGRLPLNPLAHVDPVGTVLMPALLFISHAPFLFGYAKPVPIGWSNLRNPARDMVWVAAAGPAMNFLLALLSAVAFGLLSGMGGSDPLHFGGMPDRGFAVVGPLAVMAYRSILINVVLAVFNLLPIPPLDGGRVAVGLLPHGPARALARVEPYGFLIVFGLLLTGTLGFLIGPVIHLILILLQPLM